DAATQRYAPKWEPVPGSQGCNLDGPDCHSDRVVGGSPPPSLSIRLGTPARRLPSRWRGLTWAVLGLGLAPLALVGCECQTGSQFNPTAGVGGQCNGSEGQAEDSTARGPCCCSAQRGQRGDARRAVH